jgi:hypothetical protein
LLEIKQNNHDVAVLSAIKNFFNAGYLKPKYNIKNLNSSINTKRKTTTLCIRNTQKVIDLLDQYPLYTMKNLDYLD